MHKFFCSFNQFTQKYELTQSKPNNNWLFGARINAQTENTLLGEIKSLLQEIYFNIVLVKEKETNENRLNLLDETELLISNLYYSLFASPLELPERGKSTTGTELPQTLELVGKLEKAINIPEYNRIATIIRNNISSLI